MSWTVYKWVVEYPSSNQALADREKLVSKLNLHPREVKSMGDEIIKVEIAKWWQRVVQATCATRNGNNPSLASLISILGNPSTTERIIEGLPIEKFV